MGETQLEGNVSHPVSRSDEQKTQPQHPLKPSAGHQLVFCLALFASYALLFILARWIVTSTQLVPNHILPAFIKLSGLFTRFSIASGIVQHGASDVGDFDARRLLMAMSLFYYLAVYVLSSVLSVVAQFGSSHLPYNNQEPRLHKYSLGGGLPHRVIATHDALYDFFPAYTITAVFAAVSLPPSTSLGVPTLDASPVVAVVLPALALHVAVKVGVWAPAYVLDASSIRSVSHIFANAALILALLALVGA
ncbi:hypothetical protein BV22DRAFT_1193720 [Leucogyrophana mollusca]|uniref:Uncharacterized protein n=1 Tax=Leucogyrophana mollusca TaxID=85980 RepID=A0ACB8BRL6_9AGAM|nr:hypothetical protein BV22DRAFT_1193720 [Leucogyrophana mollusca]